MPKSGERITFGELSEKEYAIFKPDDGTCEKPFLVYIKTGANEAKALMTYFEFKRIGKLPSWKELEFRTPCLFGDSIQITILAFMKPPSKLANIIRLNRRFRKR